MGGCCPPNKELTYHINKGNYIERQAVLTEDFENLEKEVGRIVKNRVFPVLIRALIAKKILDIDRLEEGDYILSTIKENTELIDDLRMIVSIDENFIESARDAIEMHRPEVAIVLITTVIEHQLNILYREALLEHDNLDDDSITEIIRNNTISDKTGWLFNLILRDEMDYDLKKELLKLAELRNQIVHYKAFPQNIDDENNGSHNKIRIKIEELNFEEIFTTLTRLSRTLEEAFTNLRLNTDDDYKHAKKAIQSLHNFLQDDG
jgi:hypothetical protein